MRAILFQSLQLVRRVFRHGLGLFGRSVTHTRWRWWSLPASAAVLHADPIPMKSAEATFQGATGGDLAYVIDEVEAGPQGWSVAPKITEPQALVVRCARPVVAAELDITLFFLSGRPNCSIAEFDLAYTTDDEPSLGGNWEPLVIQRYGAEVVNLSRLPNGRLRASIGPAGVNGVIPDDTYRIVAQLPGGRATGFRLRAFPLINADRTPYAMRWSHVRDFVLTEFRVAEHVRATTNIALHCAVRNSHPLYGAMTPLALTDGLPATIALPGADPDGDGLSNIGEFAFKGDPTQGGSRGLIAVTTIDTSGNTTKELTLTLAVRTGAIFTGTPSLTATVQGVTYTAQGSLDLADAFAAPVTELTPALTPAQTGLPDITGSGWEYHSFILTGSDGLPNKGFLRAKTEGQ